MKTPYTIIEMARGNRALLLDDGRLLPMPGGGTPDGDDDPPPASPASPAAAAHPGADDDNDPADPAPTDSKPAIDLIALETRLATAEQALQDRDERLRVFEEERQERENERLAREGRDPATLKEREYDEAFMRRMDRAFGPGATDDFREYRASRQRQDLQHARDAQEYMATELSEYGIDVTELDTKGRQNWELALGGQIEADPELLARFRDPTRQREAIREAFTRVRDGLINPVTVRQGGKTLEKLAKRRDAVLGGGAARAGAPSGDRKPFALPAGVTDPDEIERLYKAHMFGDLDQNLQE
jgi:hypothetical protein